ncbi:MAG TPA: tetratricopeptide repeat protein [Vicinamibacterales bacterium]|nr:tetratricopeptide repeat protein [Vicinamibacterales bacterium]
MVPAEEQIDVLNGRVFEMYQQRQFVEAIETAKLAYQLSTALLGEQHPKTAAALNNLAELHRVLGNDAEAEPLLERSLALSRQIFGETHANVGLTLNNLAILHYQRGDHDEALALARQALEILLPALGPADVSVGNLYRALEAIAGARGDLHGSTGYLYEAARSDRQRLGDTDDTVLEGFANVARRYEELGDFESAASALRDVLAVVRARVGENSATTATVLERLAGIETRLRHRDAAIALYRDAISARRAAAGADPLPLADALDALAMVHSGAREYDTALPLMTEALDLRRTVLGADSEEVARTLNNVGALHVELGNYSEAEPLYQQAIDIVRRTSGENTARYGSALANLANFYHRLGRHAEAEPRYLQAIAVMRTALGADHPDVATVSHNLGNLYYQTARYAAAGRLFEDALAIRRRTLGDLHPSLAATMAELARVRTANGRLDEAGALLGSALEIDRAVYGEDHPVVRSLRRELVAHYVRAGDDDSADSLLRAELERMRRESANPQLVAMAIDDLAALCEKRGSPEAITLRTESVALRRAGGQTPALARALVGLAALYHAGGNYAAAEPLYQEALTIWQSEADAPVADVASTLERLGDLCTAIGEALRARPLYGQAISLLRGSGETRRAISPAEKLLSNVRAAAESDPSNLISSLNNLAELHRESSSLDAAGPLYDEALALAKNVNGSDQVMAMLLNNVGLLHTARGEYAAARGPLERAVEIGRAGGGRTLAFASSNLAQAYQSLGDFGAAGPLFHESLEARRHEFGEVSPEVAIGLHNLGRFELATGKYVEARTHLEQALAIRRAIGGDGHPDYALSLTSLAEVHYKLGHLGNAETLLRLALHIQQRVLSSSDPAIALTLGNLGAVYTQLASFAYAEQLIRQGGDILRRALGERHPYVAQNANLLAQLFVATGNHAAAEEHFLSAVSITRANGDRIWLAALLNNLALLYQSQGRISDAIDLLREALAIRRETLGDAHADVGQTLNNLAAISMWIDPAGAKSLLESALAIRRDALGAIHDDVAQTLNNLAAIHQALGEFAEAEPLLREAVDIRRRSAGEDHPDYALTLHNLAMLTVALGRPAEGLALSRQVERIHDGVMAQISGIASERRRLELAGRLSTTFEAFLSLVLQHFRDDPDAVSAACTLLLSRKALGAEALAVQRDAVLGGRYPQLASTMREVAVLRAEIAGKALSVPSGSDAAAESLRSEMRELLEKKEMLESELARQVPEVGMTRAAAAATAASVARALPPDTTLIEYVRCTGLNFRASPLKGQPLFTEARYAAFVLPAGRPEGLKLFDLGEAGRIDALIARLRESITGEPERREGSSGDEVMEDASKSLRALVFEPLAGTLHGCPSLFVAPDGDLSRLPFEVLPSVDGRCLIDDFVITYLSAGRDVLRFAIAAPTETSPPLVVADPDFDLGFIPRESEPSSTEPEAEGDTYFEALPETRIEGEDIARLLGVQAIVGPDVLESTIKRQRSPRVMHIATHGFFEPEGDRSLDEAQRTLALPTDSGGVVLQRVAPRAASDVMLRSGLALAGANGPLRGFTPPREAEDGILTAEDVGMLELTGTDLVVLSACETGLGTIRAGEGVFGLRRAFTVAGARTLVMSLWKVPDEETRELMIDVYRRLLAGEGCADALRAVQLSMKARKPEPLYWGAFICQGNPGPLGDWRTAVAGS